VLGSACQRGVAEAPCPTGAIVVEPKREVTAPHNRSTVPPKLETFQGGAPMSETTIAPIAGVTAGAPTSSRPGPRQRLYFADDPTNRKVEATVAAFAFASAVSAKGLSQHPC
jgi:hypothetical protein